MIHGTMLDPGTRVQVNRMRGRVIDTAWVQSHPSGMIAQHTIKFTEQLRGGKSAYLAPKIKPKWVTLAKPIICRVHHRAIQILEPRP